MSIYCEKGKYAAFITISVRTLSRPKSRSFGPTGHAQDSDRVNVTIPFDFVVGDKQLKAGNYVVESLLDGRALKFRSKRGDVQQIAFTVPITNQTGNHK